MTSDGHNSTRDGTPYNGIAIVESAVNRIITPSVEPFVIVLKVLSGCDCRALPSNGKMSAVG